MAYATVELDLQIAVERVDCDDDFNDMEKAIFNRIVFLTHNRQHACCANNNYFCKSFSGFGMTEQDIEDLIWKLYNHGYISILLYFNGHDYPKRFIRIQKLDFDEGDDEQ